jgi:hypothetical protein
MAIGRKIAIAKRQVARIRFGRASAERFLLCLFALPDFFARATIALIHGELCHLAPFGCRFARVSRAFGSNG